MPLVLPAQSHSSQYPPLLLWAVPLEERVMVC
jgi:hypothetical protein